jgi:hypothetical protein
MKNEPQISRRPIKEIFCFSFYFVEGESQICQMPIKERYYIFHLILKKNEPQIGRRPIKGDIIFSIELNEKSALNRQKADKGYFVFFI